MEAQAVTKANPVGRPRKFTADMPAKLTELMSQGFSKEACAGYFGISEDTLYRWFQEYPELSEAEMIGRSASRMFWEQKGMQGTFGELEKFNSASWIFNMKNRFGWRDMQQVEHSGSLTANLTINLHATPQLPAIDAEYEMIEAPDEADTSE